MATRVRSYSKVNLGLAIGPVRADGFHDLVTLYQTLALHDVVTVEVRQGSRFEVRGSREDTRITLTTNHPGVPTDGRNTAWRMVERTLERMGLAAEVAIHIEKNLPVQGGLGAGSANAAAALIALEHELRTMLPPGDRLELAAEVGSDVPLFLLGGTVLGTGRGEMVSAMPDLPLTWCVVAEPEVGVSTARAFQEWEGVQGSRFEVQGSKKDEEGSRFAVRGSMEGEDKAGLTSAAQPDRLEELSRVYASVFGENSGTGRAFDTSGIVRGFYPESKQGGSEGETFGQGQRDDLAGNTLLALVRTGIENDFEQVVFPQYPLLREIKRLLMGSSAGVSTTDGPADASGNAVYAALSGSGSALFGLYLSEADARAAQQRVLASGCQAEVTFTLPRSEYWRTMFAE